MTPEERWEQRSCQTEPWLWDDHLDNSWNTEAKEARAERHAEAKARCATCPALALCMAWLATEPQEVAGVIAGTYYQGRIR